MGLTKTKESVGVIPPQGVKFRINELEPTETGENSANPGMLMYVAHLEILEPKRFAGTEMRDWFVIGTPKDKKAKKDETWERSGPRDGPGRLRRLFNCSGTPVSDDDEEFCEAIENAEVWAHLGKRNGRDGTPENRIDSYYKETDKDFVGVGEKLTAEEAPKGGKGAGPANARARAAAAKDDPDEDEPPTNSKGREAKASKGDTDDDDDDKPAKSARGRKARPADEED